MQIRGFMLVFDCATSDVESLIISLAKTCIGAAKAARQSGRIGATEDAPRRLEVLLARLLSDVLLEDRGPAVRDVLGSQKSLCPRQTKFLKQFWSSSWKR